MTYCFYFSYPYIWRILAKFYGYIISTFETMTIFQRALLPKWWFYGQNTIKVANNWNSCKMWTTEDIYLKLCQNLSFYKGTTSLRKFFTISIVFIVFLLFSIVFPVWNPCFVHGGCTPKNIVAYAKTKIDMKALDFLAPTSNSSEKSSTLGVTSMLSYA